ncbi:hypothetical protein [Streptomyces sp. 3214.6]|jgi:hypothetical protein|uniref:hypothetical protein n=1 Tax=Streptomyces sp. 3214.6 TaxID=1882757 RepID=UPI00090C1178|nr:hypothetical protein [Streptomyces sp. 3214.6]SHI67774.1 hypothetical protein SAMN05444521_8212 [Streptomyces sp. 3214.6]
MGRRLEAGWGQKIAWSVLVVGSLSILVWVPFLYVGIRRGRRADWITFGVFALFSAITWPWAIASSEGPGDPILGTVAILAMAAAVSMLLFTVFDKPGTKFDAVGVAQPEGRQFLQ